MFKAKKRALKFIVLIAAIISTVYLLSYIFFPSGRFDRSVSPPSPPRSLDYPVFPWPPPKYSAKYILPSEIIRTTAEGPIYFRDIAQKITSALNQAGYYSKSYFAMPDGFAMVTRMEQIYPDGRPKEEAVRWLSEIEPLHDFTLAQYLSALFKANEGFYRIIVFIVTPHPFSRSDVTVSRETAMDWFDTGLNKLPNSIGANEFTVEHDCTALIYEFNKTKGDSAILVVPSRNTGRSHLEKAGIWLALNG